MRSWPDSSQNSSSGGRIRAENRHRREFAGNIMSYGRVPVGVGIGVNHGLASGLTPVANSRTGMSLGSLSHKASEGRLPGRGEGRAVEPGANAQQIDGNR